MSNKKTDKKKGRKIIKLRNQPLRLIVHDRPHPPRNKGKGPVKALAQVGVTFNKETKGNDYSFAERSQIISKQNILTTIGNWKILDEFKNEDTKINFIINHLTTESMWRARTAVAHMGWHIPDLLLTLYEEEECSAKQILQIVDGFEGVNKFNTKDWKENKELITGPKPDVVTYIEVKGPVNFKMEFATYTDNRREKCLILNNAYEDRPLYQQWAGKTTTGEKLVDGFPAWQRYAPYDSILGDSVLTLKSKRVNASKERSKKEWTNREKQQTTVISKEPTLVSDYEKLLEEAKNGNKTTKKAVIKR
jgi:hypothetical protein